MSYKRKITTVTVKFDGDYDGLEVVMKALKIKTFKTLIPLMTKSTRSMTTIQKPFWNWQTRLLRLSASTLSPGIWLMMTRTMFLCRNFLMRRLL